jgi:2Fe-2S ferredoxin
MALRHLPRNSLGTFIGLDDMLDEAPVTPESRLSCQCVPNGTTDIVVVIPKWNRNQVKE